MTEIISKVVDTADNIDNEYFKVIKETKLSDLKLGVRIPESDLTIQMDDRIIQFEYVDGESTKKQVIIKPGCFSIEQTNFGTILDKFPLREYTLLKTIDNTSSIIEEANRFFNRLDVYKQLKREPKRSILLCSDPGVGKTAAINQVCREFLEDEGTAVIIWDTSSIKAQTVNKFFLSNSKFSKKTKRLIMVIEDIDGSSIDEYEGGMRGAESALLNLLDGVGSPFKGVPTFIIATTNNPETSVKALIDRPGRFDKVIELKSPKAAECAELLRFIKKSDELTEDELTAAELAAENKFSIAHLQESVVRAMIDDISILEATQQLVAHKKRFKNAFKQQAKSIGLGM